MISTILALLFVLAVLGIRCAVRIARRRLSAADPFAHLFGEVAPLPAGSWAELHSFNHSARPASRADQGSGGNGKSSQGAAAARTLHSGSERLAR